MGRKPLLTKEKVLVTLQRWTARNGGQPSVEELRCELGVASTRTVFRYLQMLEADGAIKRRPGAPGVKLLKPRAEGAQTRAVPVVGRVPAGALMLAEENIEGWIHLPKALARPASDKFFLLRVRGTSMNRAKVGGNTIEDGPDTLTIREYHNPADPDNSTASTDGTNSVINYNTRLDDFRGAPPVVVLYHEFAHVYDYMNDTFDSTPYSGDDPTDRGIRQGERQATGLPIDHDHDPSTPEVIDPDHDLGLTENGLRDEMGLPDREHYG